VTHWRAIIPAFDDVGIYDAGLAGICRQGKSLQNENTEAGIVNRNILRVNIPWPAATTGMKKTR
jgi:hypothetical protein